MGTAVWQMMRQGRPRPKQVSEERLEECQSKTEQMLEYFADEAPHNSEDSVATMLEGKCIAVCG
jgi:hypothetical protein